MLRSRQASDADHPYNELGSSRKKAAQKPTDICFLFTDSLALPQKNQLCQSLVVTNVLLTIDSLHNHVEKRQVFN